MKLYSIEKQTIIGLWVLVMASACQVFSPISAADTLEQRAYATYGTFVIFQERAVALVEGPDLSRSAKLAIIRAEDRAKPVADSLVDAIMTYEEIKSQVAEGVTPEDELMIAAERLDEWVVKLAPLVTDLVASVRGET